MRVLSEKGSIAQKIREVEEILRDKGISLSHRCDGFIITVATEDGKEVDCVIRDGESGEVQDIFPTQFDPSRIQRLEDYINGT